MASSYDSIIMKDVFDKEGRVTGQKKVLKKETGVCMVQKDARDRSRKKSRDLFREVG